MEGSDQKEEVAISKTNVLARKLVSCQLGLPCAVATEPLARAAPRSPAQMASAAPAEAGAAAAAAPAEQTLGWLLYAGATDFKAAGRSPVKEEVREHEKASMKLLLDAPYCVGATRQTRNFCLVLSRERLTPRLLGFPGGAEVPEHRHADANPLADWGAWCHSRDGTFQRDAERSSQPRGPS